MKNLIRIVALVLLAAVLGFWLWAGANRGWTKTQVQVKTLDEVTGIEGVSYQKKFQPGVDFLGAGLLLAGAFGAGSIFIRKPKPNQ